MSVGSGTALFVLTQYLQLVRSYSAFTSGLAVLPLAVGTVLGSVVGARAPARIGARWSTVSGLLMIATGFAVLGALTPTSVYPVVTAGLLLVGGGVGFAGPAATNTVLSAIPRQRAGMGSALNDAHSQLGVALGIAGLGSVLAAVYRANLPPAAAASLSATLAYATGQPAGGNLAEAAALAFSSAQSVTMLAAAGCDLAGAVIAFVVLRPDTPLRLPTVITR